MIRLLITLSILLFFGVASYAQEAVQVRDSPTASEASMQEADQLSAQLKAQKNADKELKKAEKSEKRAEKEIKKREQLAKSITKKGKSIDKNERKIVKMEAKFAKDKIKGKLSPVDIIEMSQKIDKMRLDVLKDKEKLAKLERKQ